MQENLYCRYPRRLFTLSAENIRPPRCFKKMANKLLRTLLWQPISTRGFILSPPFLSCDDRLHNKPWTGKLRYCLMSEIIQDNDVDVKARSSVISRELQNKGINRFSEGQIESIYQLLLDLGIKAKTIDSQLVETPDILNYPAEKWNRICEVFVENGISSYNIFKNIVMYPELLQQQPSRVRDLLLQYRAITIGKENVLQLIQRYPVLYLVPPSKIKKRLALLNTIFAPTESRPLIRNNPNILCDDWQDVSDKMMYIHTEMGLEQPQISASQALEKSLMHIKTRHLFLSRAGLYVKPNLLRDKMSHRRNPSLSDITDTSNRFFANKVAKLSEEEYKVFSEMIREELDASNSDSDDSEDEEYHTNV
ncbi:transcription termination factor 4, mitochondrial-like [Penaeus monodon]|uniref:transcription termination factor 4, mitochondrial-like n=1 Tax=Penaeus monodon TaxID=6687 RepID=UPI0018A71E84|nr:transcription termination factor 4, mitochondrial-like [Penaeus monodon]